MSDKVDQILKMMNKLSESEKEELFSLAPQIIKGFSSPQREMAKEDLVTKNNTKAVLCVYCSSDKIRSYGAYRGRKRYKCLSCSRTFNDLTGSAISGTHHPDKWRAFVDCMATGLSVAKTADKVGISVPTAFTWRHKLLEKYEKEAGMRLQGIIEADETFFLFSEKGNKNVSKCRKPRKRGGKAKKRGISDEQVPVIVGCDRKGNVILGVAGRGRISMAAIENILNNYIDSEVTLCTDAHRSFKAYAKAYDLSYVALNISGGRRVVRKKYHIQNVNSFHSRLKRWMLRFNGVSTKYLQNYMNWFSLLEETKVEFKNQTVEFMKRSVPSFVL